MRTPPTFRSRLLLAVSTIALLAWAVAPAGAAPLFEENFNYAAPSALNGQGGWAAHSAAGTNAQTVNSGNLSYPGYPSSGIGNLLGPIATSGEDNNHTFAGQTSGVVYLSALVSVASSQTTGDYFLHYFDGPITGNTFRGRLFVKKDASSTNFAFGIQFGSTLSNVYTPFSYVPGTTYLVVVKYTFVAGSNNDVVSLYVDPAISPVEPAPTLSHADAGQTDAVNLDGVAIRQGSSANAASVAIDGIRVSLSWSDAVGAASDHTITASAGPGGTIQPSGAVTVADGDSATFTITAESCYAIADVLVDGSSVGPVSSYTFYNVTADHTIAASFVSTSTATTTTLSASPTSGKAASVINLTAVVSPSDSTAGGTVSFYDNASLVGSAPVVRDTARFSAKFDEGSHSFTAAYSGFGCRDSSTSSAVNVTLGPAPSITINDTTRVEGETGTPTMTFRVRLSSPVNNTVTVDYHTEDGTATAGVDYVATSGTATFAPNTVLTTIQIPLIPDNDQEPWTSRTFTVVLTNPVKATIADSAGTGTILEDDTPTIVINNFARNEDALVPSFTFTVSLNHGVSHTVTVDYTTQDNTATVDNNDYEAQSGTLTFNPKETTKPITITVNADSVREQDNVTPWENFRVLLSNATGATIADNLGIGTIQDDDGAPQIYVDDVPPGTLEGAHGELTPFTFRVRLQGSSAVQQVRVNYTTVDGTATAGSDYIAQSGTLTFDFKETEKFVTVLVRGDDVANQGAASCEADETFSLRITNPRGGNIFDNTGDAVIVDDDCIVPTTLSLFRAEALASGIEVRWQFADPALFTSVTLERSPSNQGPWATVPATLRDEDGVTVALDGTIESGHAYWYRLVGREAGGAATVFGPLAATAGTFTYDFALASIWPNPAKGFARIDYVVPRQANVRLSIIDVQGRELKLLASGTMGAGRYQATWNGETERGKAPVGLYFVRYQAGSQTQIKRLVMAP